MDGDEEDINQENIDYEALEEELDLVVPVIADNVNDDTESEDDDVGMVPNGYHEDDVADDSDNGDEEIPLQPRIMLGGVMAVLGQQRVDDSDNDEEEDNDDDPENREVFDSELPARHAYLGDGRQLGGRTILEDDSTVSLPLLNQPGLALVPGQLLPLHIFHPSMISMIMNVINTSKTFGVVSLKADSASWKGLVGTTAEIFEYNNSDDNTEDRDNHNVGLKIKARGRQRFKLVSTRRQVDGNLVGEVKMLSDNELGEPDEAIRIPSWNRFMKLETPPADTQQSPEEEKKSCFSFLSMLRTSSSSSTSSSSAPYSCPTPAARWRRRYPSHVVSPIPAWLWSSYSPSHLVTRVRAELAKLSSLSPNIASVPTDPTLLSWWVTTNLPLEDNMRSTLLALNSPVQRLRVTLSFLSQCRVLVCKRCGKQLGDQQHIFSMSKEGPQGAFVNPGGHVHETLTLYRAKNLRLVGRPSTEYSWFPGYAWIITECLGCWSHIGWKFIATNKKLKPDKFYGFSRKNIEAKVEVPHDDDAEQEESDDVESNIIVI